MKERISVVANGTGHQACIFLGSPMLNRQCLTFDGGADGGCASLTRPTKTGYVLRDGGCAALTRPTKTRFAFCVGWVSVAHPPLENEKPPPMPGVFPCSCPLAASPLNTFMRINMTERIRVVANGTGNQAYIFLGLRFTRAGNLYTTRPASASQR